MSAPQDRHPTAIHTLPSSVPATLYETEDEAHQHRTGSVDQKAASDLEDGDRSSEPDLVKDKSKGVVEMEALQSRLTKTNLAVIYVFFMILSYTLSLNQYTAGSYLTYGVSWSFGKHSLQATVSTIASVFQAMSQPPLAKWADALGRANAYIGCLFFYVLGYIIVASSPKIAAYAAGNSIYVVGISGLFLFQNIIIADISSLRNRYFWTILPSVPQVINAFVAANVVSSLMSHGDEKVQWRWGFGMFTILIPAIAAPRLSRPSRAARAEIKAAKAARAHQPLTQRIWTSSKATFWQLDFIGLVLFIIGFGLFFVTITLANSKTARWSDAHSIAQLVLGVVFIIAFVIWERFSAPHPLLPFALLKRKTVWGCIILALWHPMAGRVAASYLLTFLQVAANQSTISANRITTFPSLAGWISALIGAYVSHRWRILKPIIMAGCALEVLATGLMIHYRTSTNTQAELAIVQLLRGASNGLIPYPVQALIQAASPHEHLAAITAGWLVVYYIAGGAGSAIAGAMWTNIVPKKLNEYLGGNVELVTLAFSNPFAFAKQYPPGTPERAAIAHAQDDDQRTMVIVGTCISVLGLLAAIFLIDNIRLPDTQSIEEIEQEVKDGEKKEKKMQAIVEKV